ncbi:hypothetical protein KR074_008266, partial [Drosophila pseudoananassae]
QIFPFNVRNDYCELYCRGPCENRSLNKTCKVLKNIVTTAEYKIKNDVLVTNFHWIAKVFNQWNLQKISWKTDFQIYKLTVTGLEKAYDARFCPGIFYLKSLGIFKARAFILNSPSLIIIEEDVHYIHGPEKLIIKLVLNIHMDMDSFIIKNYTRSATNITELKIFSLHSNQKQTLRIVDNFFEGMSKLKKIEFDSLKVKGLAAEHFNDLPILEYLIFEDVDLDNLDFFGSEVLQKTLRCLTFLNTNGLENMEYLPLFSKLKIIEFDRLGHIPFSNLTVFLCYQGEKFCNFTIGINYITCPQSCHCQYERKSYKFSINCSRKNLLEVQPLPIPINGSTSLILQGNNLTQLPHKSLPGYSIVKELDVSYNKLTTLAISHLPYHLEYLDVRFNQLHTLSEDVIHYLYKVPFFYQYGNKWSHVCDEIDMMYFFKQKSNTIRIHESKFNSIFENMIDINRKFNIKEQFQKSSSYYFAKEDNITKRYPGNGILMALEYLHKNISYYSAEYDPILYDDLNAPCPYRCMCCTLQKSNRFLVNCENRNLHFYPELPNPIQNNATLFLRNNYISTLPTPTFSKGHTSMKYLLMANNSLTELPLQVIPKNILKLDLTNNQLRSLDKDVVKFLWDRKNIISVYLSGNPWECKCEAILFLYFLREYEPFEYIRVLKFNNLTSGRCPESCICCEETSLTDPFVIDCTNNKLTFIDQLPSQLIYVDLSHNNISVLNEDIRNFLVERIRSSQMTIRLSGNPWSCTCEDRDFLKFVKGQAMNIIDSSSMTCSETGYSLIDVQESDICPSALIYYATLTASLLILILGINLLVIFRQPILIWFYEHEICLSLAARRELDLEKKFDAFLSFTHKDEGLIEEFVERLENGNHKFRLCFYLRDWLVGEAIPECITRSVKDSRRIIILMTNNFLKSNWGRLEFRLALHATAKDRCKRLIVVLYPDVENFDDLDSELRAYMVLNTYLARDSPNFWNKLIYSMP